MPSANKQQSAKREPELHYGIHNNPMRRQCQFTVKRFEVNYSNMELELTTSCLQGKRIAMFALVSVNPVGFGWRGFSLIVLDRPLMGSTTAANYAANCSERDHAFLSIQLHSVTLTSGSLIGHENLKAHSLRVRLLRNKWIC